MGQSNFKMFHTQLVKVLKLWQIIVLFVIFGLPCKHFQIIVIFNYYFLQKIPSIAYLTDLLHNGFYCFESMTVRNMDNTICGICGVLGEIYLGDGNEKKFLQLIRGMLNLLF